MLHRRPAVAALERRRRGERNVLPAGCHEILGEHRLCAARDRGGARRGGRYGPRSRHPFQARRQLLGDARRRRGEPARDDERVRDACRSRDVPSSHPVRLRQGPRRRRHLRRREQEPARAHPERRGGGQLRARGCHRWRDRYGSGAAGRTPRGGEDGHRAGLLGRLVLRLHAATRHVRVDGLSEGPRAARLRQRRGSRLRRDPPGRDLARLHDRCDGPLPEGH